MAARITPEQIEQINEVYAQCGVKTKTAKIVGVSVASVTKYLIDGYIPKADRTVYTFDKEPNPISSLEIFLENFEDLMNLSKEEWEDLKELQKEIMV